MNKEEKKLAHKFGFDWVKIHPGNFVTVGQINNFLFYGEMIPKFLIHLVKNYKRNFISFLYDYREELIIERYALQNKHLHNRFGDFKKDNNLFGGSIDKALEIDPDMGSKMAHVGEEINFQKEIKKRTEPYTHFTTESNDDEKRLEERKKFLEGKGLGEIVAVKIEEEEDDRRAFGAEEERT